MRRQLLALAGALLVASAFTLPGEAKVKDLAPQVPYSHGYHVSHYNYLGARWADMRAFTCVEDRQNTVKAAGKSIHTLNAVRAMQKTGAHIVYTYGVNGCPKVFPAANGQRIIMVDAYYGKNGWWSRIDWGPVCSSTKTYACIKWGSTVNGHFTWTFTRFVVIQLNLSYGVPNSTHLALHELAHVTMGLKDRPTTSAGAITCNSIVAYCPPGNGATSLYANDYAWYNEIWPQ